MEKRNLFKTIVANYLRHENSEKQLPDVAKET